MVKGPVRREATTRRAGARTPALGRLTDRAWIPAAVALCVVGAIAALLVLSLSSGSTNSSGPSVGVAQSSLGKILVDRRGLTLYLYTHDKPDSSACAEVCARVWPPATVSGKPTAAAGVSFAKLRTNK